MQGFRLAGQYFDAETGLHYNYHRYYDPSIGRYLRPDPIKLFPQSTNLQKARAIQ
ncbi:RHS repeat-associated core domain-containing protein [Thermodesulfobacteriota bacterium]